MEFIYLFSEQSSVLCFVFSNHFQCLLRFAVLLFSYIIFSVVFTATALGPRHEVLVPAVAPVPVHAILELARGLRSAWDFSKCGSDFKGSMDPARALRKNPTAFRHFSTGFGHRQTSTLGTETIFDQVNQIKAGACTRTDQASRWPV